MTADVETMLALSEQLIEAGQQLGREARNIQLEHSEEDLVLPETKDFLSEFSWEMLQDHREETSWWYAQGTPLTDGAKKLIEAVSASIENTQYGCTPKTRTLSEQLSEWGDPLSLYIGTSPPVCGCLLFHLKSADELTSWLQTYSYLKLTNSPDSLNEIRQAFEKAAASIKEEWEIARKRLETFTKAIENLKPEPVALNTIDWNEVAAGKLPAPILIRLGNGADGGISRTGRTEGEWIYAGPGRVGWDYAYSHSHPDGGRTQIQAIAHMKCGTTSFSALYLYRRDGIAELVASKNHPKKDPTANAISVNAINWGEQEAPQLIKDIKFNERVVGQWIYAGPATSYGGPQWSWDDSKEASSERGLSEESAIARVELRESSIRAFSALYRYVGTGIAELVYVNKNLGKES